MKPRVNADEPIIPDFIVDPDAKNFLKLRILTKYNYFNIFYNYFYLGGAEKIVKENKRLLGKI